MPIVDHGTVAPATPAQMQNWRPLHRIENTGGNVQLVGQAIQAYPFEALIYAEGDSWFDKFTPIAQAGSNLLALLRLPRFAGLVDVSHIGDTSQNMVSGWQRRQTRAMFKLFDFNAIVLSAGGNDLKNLFASLYDDLGERRQGRVAIARARELDALDRGQVLDEHFDKVMQDIQDFIALRNGSARVMTRGAPLFLHGYDYLQPRPAPAQVFAGTSLGAGPWIYPSLQHAGLDDAQMRTAAAAVIDVLNVRLRALVAALPADANVWLLDQRGLLILAEPRSTSTSGDWIDEIHPAHAGFEKLAQARWNPWLAHATGMLS